MKRPFLLTALLLLLFASCKQVQYVPIETVRTEYKERTKYQVDSIRTHDSIYIERKGDTLLKERFTVRYLTRIKADTLYISRVDSVAKPYPVEVIKTVKKSLTWYEKALNVWGLLSLGAVVGLVGWKMKKII